jgi:tRNA A37 threonylcarbamoyladenosine biosynthesis protein TsaE
VLARTVTSPRFTKVEVYSPRNVLHAFRLASPDEIDDQFSGWLGEANRVGAQEHLAGGR